jgi:3-oxoacyl-[acyl-carrier-protein] synthase-3
MRSSEAHLLAVGTALPGPPLDNAALARRFGMDGLWEQWVDAFIGTRTRHLALDLASGHQSHTLADLGTIAGQRALAGAGTAPGEVDLVVLGTCTPDRLMPATVNIIADRLGIDGVSTYQLQSGCAGAVGALKLARDLLATGQYRTALVLGGDVVARFYDVEAELHGAPPTELVNYVLFGDGAGAAVLRTEPGPGSVVLRAVHSRLVGLGQEPGAVLEWFGVTDRESLRPAATEDYKAVEERVPVLAAEVLRELLGELDWKDHDLDYVLPPQLSGRMTERILDHLALPHSQPVSCVAEIGNNGNGLVFFQLERALDRMEFGERAVGIAIESSKWIKSGFALERV